MTDENGQPIPRCERGGMAESRVAEERLVFNVSMGGIDQESLDSLQIAPSPQIRQVNPTSTLYVPFVVVPQNQIFRLKKADWKCFSGQGYQDLVVSVQFARQYLKMSGKLTTSPGTTPPFDNPTVVNNEVRNLSVPGLPLTSIAQAVPSTGRPDNFAPTDDNFFNVAYETELVTFVVENQSDVYTHGIWLEMTGWMFPILGRGKKEIFEAIAK